MNKQTKAIVATLVTLPLVVGVMLFAYYRSGQQKLQASVVALIHHDMRLDYEVNAVFAEPSLTDLGALWWLSAHVDVTSMERLAADNTVADPADLEYFKGVVRDRFDSMGIPDLSSYRLSRIERSLGANTICEATACNIYVLWSAQENSMFVGIYRT